MREGKQRKYLPVLIGLSFIVGSCIVMHNSVDTQVTIAEVDNPVKVHLKDGRTAVFRFGAQFSKDSLRGKGTLYSLSLEKISEISGIDRNEIAAYEVFDSKVNTIHTIVSSTLAVGLTGIGVGLLSIALFGSCPTIYSPADTAMALETELFSNSIAPMLETRDVARLQAGTDEKGNLVLEVRNEALETHYINQIGLMKVLHKEGDHIAPTATGKVLALNHMIGAERVTNTLGKDLRSVFELEDEYAYETDIIERNGENRTIKWDTLEVIFPSTESDAAALHMTLRNSLFSTVLLYDYLLASQGLAALDWIGEDLSTVSGAVALGDFDRKYNGLRVEQFIDGEYKQLERIPNLGPIAWRELAVPLAATSKDSLRLRLIFLADSWRIDRIKLAWKVRAPEVKYIGVSKITDANGKDLSSESLNSLNHADEKYFVTYPGEKYELAFEVDSTSQKSVTYLLEGSGYYIEWIRENWTKEKKDSPRMYSEAMLIEAQQKWAETKAVFQKQFFDLKIPVQ